MRSFQRRLRVADRCHGGVAAGDGNAAAPPWWRKIAYSVRQIVESPTDGLPG